MRKVNLITKAQADEKAKNYFDNSEAQSLHITRDGQIFLNGSGGFMKMHERDCKLEASWPYQRHQKIVVEETTTKGEDSKQDWSKVSFATLKGLANERTTKGDLKLEDWENLKYQELKKFLKDK